MTWPSRDSQLLWLGVGLGVVGYLVTCQTDPLHWTYREWMQAASVAFIGWQAKLQKSPLKGDKP